MSELKDTITSVKETTDLRNEIEANLGAPKFNHRGWAMWSCPFHDEKTAGGFIVYRNRYKCYSCGKTGDIFDWWQFWTGKSLVELVDNHTLSPSEEVERKKIAAEMSIKRLEQEIELAKQALNELKSAVKWEVYHNNLNSENRHFWRTRGVPDWYQDYMKLGINPDKVLYYEEKEYHTPTITIPFYKLGFDCVNLKHRLLQPPTPGWKYSYEHKGLPSNLFIAEPDMTSLSGRTLLVEGEIKAMVSMVTADDPTLQVIGMPGKSPRMDMLDELKDCEPIYMCLDPDAYEFTGDMKSKDQRSAVQVILDYLGRERVRVIKLPQKIDDFILETKADKTWMNKIMQTARML